MPFLKVIEANELAVLDHSKVRFVDLSQESVYQQLHLPNAIHISPKKLLRQDENGAMGLLPELEELQQLISDLQLSEHHQVIAYDDEGGGWASRLLWTLHCIGFTNTALLNGGLQSCLREKVPMTSKAPQLDNAEKLFEVDLQDCPKYRIMYDELLEKVQQQHVQLWDCRSIDEYVGTQRTARRAGHIPNAIHYEWTELFNKEDHYRLKPLSEIRAKLGQLGFDLNQPVIVYCQSHHRSSLAYVVAHLLNWEVRAYDGAWSEWGNQEQSLIKAGNER